MSTELARVLHANNYEQVTSNHLTSPCCCTILLDFHVAVQLYSSHFITVTLIGIYTCVISPKGLSRIRIINCGSESVRNRPKLSKKHFGHPLQKSVFVWKIGFRHFQHVQRCSSFLEYFWKHWVYLSKPKRRVSKFRSQWRAGQLPIFYFDPIRDKNVKWEES